MRNEDNDNVTVTDEERYRSFSVMSRSVIAGNSSSSWTENRYGAAGSGRACTNYSI